MARQAWEQGQTKSLSMADKIAVAQEKANEHNQSPNRQVQAPRKSKSQGISM